MSDLEVGKERITQAIAQARAQYGRNVIFVEHLRNFGDCMHSTIVIRHYRKTIPDCTIVFGISEKYVSEFETLKSLPDGPHIIVGLPHGPQFPDDGPLRVAWTRYTATLPGVYKVVTPSVHPYGWRCGSMSEAIFHNADIKKLEVPRRPVLPIDIADYAWADSYMRHFQLTGNYVTMEYLSYSLKPHSLEWYTDLVKRIKCPVVGLAGKNEPLVAGMVDARGCTYRQAKVLIMRSKCFVGCASGNGLLTVSEGCETPMVEIVEPHISYRALGYVGPGVSERPYAVTGYDRTTADVASIVNQMIP